MKTMENRGKIIVIEGTDSSGKETQTALLYKKLKEKYSNVKKISFPNYESPACAPVKMYLAGEFGEKASEVNPYPVSIMYGIDRYASYKKEWESFYLNGGIIVTDRYTTSNMVHQASKIADSSEKIRYLSWLEDLEYQKIGIPKPDLIIFLNMPINISIELMKNRKNKITNYSTKDIHEKDVIYLEKSYNNACEIAKKYGWQEISCISSDNRLKTIEEISNEIYSKVKILLD